MLTYVLALCAPLLLFQAAHAQTPPSSEAENTGPNTAILRWAEGQFSYRSLKEQRERGTEKYRLTVHPDGTRTMNMWHDVFAKNTQFTVILRVDRDFRPLQAFINYWTAAGYKGSAMLTVTGNSLAAESYGPLGHLNQVISVPAQFSFGTHPVSADGWHMWYEEPKAKGRQVGTVYSMEASTDLSRPVLGMLRPQEFEMVGRETIKVPAGTFDTIHYKISGVSDAWILPKDRLMVRMVNEARNLDYVLTQFAAGDNGQK